MPTGKLHAFFETTSAELKHIQAWAKRISARLVRAEGHTRAVCAAVKPSLDVENLTSSYAKLGVTKRLLRAFRERLC